MNDEMREMLEEVSELKHKVDKIERKLQQKIGMRSGYSRGGYQRMGQNSGNWNSGGQAMGESVGVFWGGMPQSPMNQGMGGFPQEGSWIDPRYM